MADEQATNDDQPDLMGYPSVDALRDAKIASDREAKRLAEELRQERAVRYAAENQRQSVPQRGARHWTDQLVDLGVDPNPIREGIREESQQLINQAFGPITKGLQARQEMLAEDPEWAKYESDVAVWVQSDEKRKARYEALFSADPTGANQWAGMGWAKSQQKNGKVAEGVTRRSMREESAHAAIPTERSGESRRRPDEEVDLAEARKQVHDTGRSPAAVERYARLRLKQAIPDGFLNQ